MSWASRSPSRAVLLALLLPALGPAAAARAQAPRVSVVVEAGGAAAPVLAALRGARGGRLAISVHELRNGMLADPIEKGRLLASLQSGDVVVTVGDRATSFALEELEGLPVYFVGAGLLRGEDLKRSEVSGILSYNVDEFLDLIGGVWKGSIGLAYTPGWEPVAERIRAGAAERGLPLIEKRVAARREIPAALRDLTSSSRVVWVLGDPMLSRGAGFDFIVEQSLSTSVPVIGSGAWEVRNGALLAQEPRADRLGGQASGGLEALLDNRFKTRGARFEQAPEGGMFLLNRPLSRKWTISIPEKHPWSHVP